MNGRVAVIYQKESPPSRNGITKPMKPGGYSDSGADIAYSLRRQGVPITTPVENPRLECDLDWVFPDTAGGIQFAVDSGATVIWLNTVLYNGHAVEEFIRKGYSVVGQTPACVDMYDDKWTTNELLKAHGLPIPRSIMITHENRNSYQLNFSFPAVAKPIRGRGSQGVLRVDNSETLTAVLDAMFNAEIYGEALYVEEFLPGHEITITVMPPGDYSIKGHALSTRDYWSLPPVNRFNHENGIAPYNGTVAVINNSAVLTDKESAQADVQHLCRQCEQAAGLVRAKAPIRIDCRANEDGKYFLFDLNMKPNMTGPSRRHRQDQDSLTALAARRIGWQFDDLILNMLRQQWRIG